MKTLESRLMALESLDSDDKEKPLPRVVADDTPDVELERLSRAGRQVYRMSEFVQQLAMPTI